MKAAFKFIWRTIRRAFFGRDLIGLVANFALAMVMILIIGEIARWYYFTAFQAALLVIPMVVLAIAIRRLVALVFDFGV